MPSNQEPRGAFTTACFTRVENTISSRITTGCTMEKRRSLIRQWRVGFNHICVQLILSGCATTLDNDFHYLLTTHHIHKRKLSWIVNTEGGGKWRITFCSMLVPGVFSVEVSNSLMNSFSMMNKQYLP